MKMSDFEIENRLFMEGSTGLLEEILRVTQIKVTSCSIVVDRHIMCMSCMCMRSDDDDAECVRVDRSDGGSTALPTTAGSPVRSACSVRHSCRERHLLGSAVVPVA